MTIQRCANCRRVKGLASRGLCHACYQRARYQGCIDRWPLRKLGRPRSPASYAAIARALGVTAPTVKLADEQRRLQPDGDGWRIVPATIGRPRRR